MGALIATITSLWGTVAAWAIKIFGVVATTVGDWFAGIGWKLLSFQWIRNVYEFLSKIAGVVKKVFFNSKIVKLIKVVATLGLFSMAIVQTVFIARIVLNSKTEYIGDAVFWAFLIINAASIFIFALYLLAFIVGLFKKELRYGFVAALFFVYIISLFSYRNTGLKLYLNIFQSFDTLKVIFLIALGVLVIFKLADERERCCFSAFLLCVIGIAICLLIYKGGNFANIVVYGFSEEIPEVAAKDVGFIGYLRVAIEYFSGDGEILSGVSSGILLQSVAVAKSYGNFLASVAVAFNGLIIAVSSLAPYLLFTVGVGFLMSLINGRIKQVIYLTKVIRTLKYLFFGMLCMLAAAIILPFFFGTKVGIISLTLNMWNTVLSFLVIFALVILSSGARKLITDKFANKLNLKKRVEK